MRLRNRLCLALACCALFALGCSHEKDPTAGTVPTPEKVSAKDLAEANKPHKDFLSNEIPPNALDKVMEAHFEGLGLMEQYEYGKAIARFKEIHELAPGWIPGSINLAIGLLNQGGNQAEAEKKQGKLPSAGTSTSVSPTAIKMGAVIDETISAVMGARDERMQAASALRSLFVCSANARNVRAAGLVTSSMLCASSARAIGPVPAMPRTMLIPRPPKTR